MSPFHGAQALLAAVAVVLFGLRFYRLAVASAIDTRAFLLCVADLWPADPGPADGAGSEREGSLERLWEREPGRAVVRLARELARTDATPREAELLEAEVRDEATRGIAGLRMLGRIASPLAFSGVMFDMAAALGGEQGLLALQRGLPQQLALERAVLSVCIGVATSLFCFAAASRLQWLSRRRFRELGLTQDVLHTLRTGVPGAAPDWTIRLREET